MQLIKVDIKWNTDITGRDKNALQFINREQTAMFLEYNEKVDGAVYLIGVDVWEWCKRAFDHFGIEYEILSIHTLEDVEPRPCDLNSRINDVLDVIK